MTITGTLQTTPNDFVDIHAGTLPMNLVLTKVCHNSIICMLTLPEHHPLYNIIETARRTPLTKHFSPINTLLKQFDLRQIKIETIYPTAAAKQTKAKYTVRIDPTREKSIKSEASDMADFKIFSNGSATILYKKGKSGQLKTIQAYLGPPGKHNTYEAEITGAILATWLCTSKYPRNNGKKNLTIHQQPINH